MEADDEAQKSGMFVDALVLDVQLAQRCTLEVMARNDRGGKVAAQRIIALMKLLGGLLPRSSLHELLFRDDDQRLTKIQYRFWRKSAKSQDAKGNLHKALHNEMKELQISVGEYLYMKSLKQEFGDEVLIREWCPHASDLQRMRTAVALEGLVQDLPAALGDPSEYRRAAQALARSSNSSALRHQAWRRL